MGMSSQEAMNQAGITWRQLDHWTRLGLVRTEERIKASGYRRTYVMPEVHIMWVMGRLVRNGFDPSRAAKIARIIVEKNIRTVVLDEGFILTDEDETWRSEHPLH